MKFCLLTIASGEQEAGFAFFLTDPAQLDEPERRFTLSPEEIARINPNTRTAPVFRSRADAELTAKIYGNAPVLIDESKGAEGNPWGVEFRQGLFNMTSDSSLFRTAAQLEEAGFVRDGCDWVAPEGLRPRQAPMDLAGGRDADTLELDGGSARHELERYVPLYEAKMIHQFDHRWATYENGSSRDVSVAEKENADFEPSPRYWVPERDVKRRLREKGWTREWLMGWRDICRSTDERTVIAAAFAQSGCGDTLLLMFPEACGLDLKACLIANLCALVQDYAARQKVGGTHLKYNIFKQLPVLAPPAYDAEDVAFIVPRVVELTYTSHSMTRFARDLDYDGPPFGWNEERRALLRAELDAFYARKYGLTRDELRYILDPADVKGPDYPSETFRVLKKNEIAKYGEYRTARLVLQAWDTMEREAAAE